MPSELKSGLRLRIDSDHRRKTQNLQTQKSTIKKTLDPRLTYKPQDPRLETQNTKTHDPGLKT